MLYPLALALLVGSVLGGAGARPRVALVNADHVPDVVRFEGQRFDFAKAIASSDATVDLVPMTESRARRALDDGDVVAVVTIPKGFVTQLRSLIVSPTLRFETNTNAFHDRVLREVQALVYTLNSDLQGRYIAQNVDYLGVLVQGGSVQFLGRSYDVLGLNDATTRIGDVRRALPPGNPYDAPLAEVERFAHTATLALGEAKASLEATAHPILLEQVKRSGRSYLLGAQVQSYGLAIALTFAGVLIAAGALALERDENVIGRLARGLASPTALIAEKVALVALAALALGAALAVAFGAGVDIAGVSGGAPWLRLPLLLPALLVCGAAVGAVGCLMGALAGGVRTATILALAVTIPLIFLGVVPASVSQVAAHVSDLFPFAPAADAFSSALFDVHPAGALARDLAHLLVLAAVYGMLARLAAPRLRA